MGIDAEMWTILDDDEMRPLWGGSDVGWGLPPESYVFPSPSDGYTFANPAYYEGNDEFESLLADVFVACLGADPFMYMLDWQHTCYKYNPRIRIKKPYPTRVVNPHDDRDWYNVYFPTFWPNGDYYHFVASDLRWGWLTSPYFAGGPPEAGELDVFGEPLRELVRSHAADLGLTPRVGSLLPTVSPHGRREEI